MISKQISSFATLIFQQQAYIHALPQMTVAMQHLIILLLYMVDIFMLLNSLNYYLVYICSMFLSDAPKIEKMDVVNVEAVEGRNVTIPCQASGYPPPIISWNKSGQDLEPSKVTLNQNGSVTLRSIKSIDAGIYTCTASNEAGYDRKDVNVTVIGNILTQKFISIRRPITS